MPTYQIKVNGENKSVDVSADTPLLWVLRDHLDLVWNQVWLWYRAMWSLYRS